MNHSIKWKKEKKGSAHSLRIRHIEREENGLSLALCCSSFWLGSLFVRSVHTQMLFHLINLARSLSCNLSLNRFKFLNRFQRDACTLVSLCVYEWMFVSVVLGRTTPCRTSPCLAAPRKNSFRHFAVLTWSVGVFGVDRARDVVAWCLVFWILN